MRNRPGQLVLLGSGETSASGRRVFDWLFQQLPSPVRLAILETPAGFQPNSALVAQKVADFMREHLTGYTLDTTIVPARKRDTAFTPDDPTHADSLLAADCLFFGPGSPTYAARQLRESIVWDAARVRFATGAPLVLASAAVLAISAYTLPVYEIYKAGADLSWERGLDMLGAAGPTVVFIPHWNNREGGADLDTSHCFVGPERFELLRAMLPHGAVVVGIDEHTALILDSTSETGLVMGPGGVTVEKEGTSVRYGNGSRLPLSEIGELDWSAFEVSLPSSLVDRARRMSHEQESESLPDPAVPDEVMVLVGRREAARQQRDWKTADSLRVEVSLRGFQVQDTPSGPHVTPIDGHYSNSGLP